MVVVGFVAIFAGMVLTAPRGGVATGPTPFPGLDGKVYNSTTKTTNIDYRQYLYEPVELAPGQTAAGLLFFKFPDGVDDWDDLKLALRKTRKTKTY